MTISSARLRTFFLVLLAFLVILMIGAVGWAPTHVFAQDGVGVLDHIVFVGRHRFGYSLLVIAPGLIVR
jgi:hypothetical protein